MDNSDPNNYNIVRFNLLTTLLSILNKNDEEDTAYVIANYMLTNLNKMGSTSIYKVAEDCYVSRSSVQRFVKEIGYDNYTQLKQSLTEVISHEEALLNYTDHTDYSEYILNSISTMTADIAKTAKSQKFKKLLELFIKARSVVILTAEDSAPACKLLQQQMLAAGKLIRIVTSASKNISILDTLGKDDLLMVCSVSGNFALAVNNQLKELKATKALITLNRTTAFADNYALICYIGSELKHASHSIQMFKNVYTSYGLTFFFDFFYHEYYIRSADYIR